MCDAIQPRLLVTGQKASVLWGYVSSTCLCNAALTMTCIPWMCVAKRNCFSKFMALVMSLFSSLDFKYVMFVLRCDLLLNLQLLDLIWSLFLVKRPDCPGTC